jgi:uncharacterized protein YecT (DUF1311 family)
MHIRQSLRVFFITLFTFGYALSATAPAKPAPPQNNCASPTSNVEMRYCAGLEYEKADAELNRVYKQLVAVLKSEDTSTVQFRDASVSYYGLLVRAQKDWVAFRDSDCSLRAMRVFGGTHQPVEGTVCKAEKTRQRTLELRHELEWYRGR